MYYSRRKHPPSEHQVANANKYVWKWQTYLDTITSHWEHLVSVRVEWGGSEDTLNAPEALLHVLKSLPKSFTLNVCAHPHGHRKQKL